MDIKDTKNAWSRWMDEEKISNTELEALINLLSASLDYMLMRGERYVLAAEDTRKMLAELMGERHDRTTKNGGVWVL